jgi:CubicO group peptidase (beta-lactamase class C family)
MKKLTFYLLCYLSTISLVAQVDTPILFKDKAITEKWLAEKHIPALGIGYIKDGKIEQISVFGDLEKGRPAPKNTIWNVASLTKPITALVTLKLVNEGQWDLDEPVSKYWIDPDIANDPRAKKITTRLILSHQTGFSNWRWNNKSKKLAFDFEPATKYQYSGEGMEYLRHALENKFHKTLDQLAQELIFTPLDMHDSRLIWDKTMDSTRFALWHNAKMELYTTTKRTEASAADDLLTTIEDYSKFMLHIINGAGLKPELFKDLTTHQVKAKNGKYFGLGLELYDFGNNEYGLTHGGADQGVRTIAFMFPQRKEGLVIFTNSDIGGNAYEPVVVAYLKELGKKIIDIETK